MYCFPSVASLIIQYKYKRILIYYTAIGTFVDIWADLFRDYYFILLLYTDEFGMQQKLHISFLLNIFLNKLYKLVFFSYFKIVIPSSSEMA